MRFNSEIYSKEFHPETEVTEPVKAHIKKPEQTGEVEKVEVVEEVENEPEEGGATAEEVTDDGGDYQPDSE